MHDQPRGPSPALLFETINAYQRSAAIKAAVELDLFTAIGEGKETAPQLADQCQAAERGVRILCDYLVIIGFLTKEGDRYRLTPDTAVFLDRRAPAFMGGSLEFLLAPELTVSFGELTAAVRQGGTVAPDEGALKPEHPVWVALARSMMPMMAMPAQQIPRLVACDRDR